VPYRHAFILNNTYEKYPNLTEINNLFANGNPEEVWPKAAEIVRCINPAYDFSIARTAFDDVVRCFAANIPAIAPSERYTTTCLTHWMCLCAR